MNRRLSRFYSKIQYTEGCWLWKGVLKKGYGYYNTKLVHRFAYELWVGDIPNTLFVCHSCDIRNCINPKHLWLGTNQDNMTDMKQKGRSPRQFGSKNPFAKLTEQNVFNIKDCLRRKKNLSLNNLAELFQVSKSTILDIKMGRTWQHLVYNEYIK